MSACAVAGCPALAAGRSEKCALHQRAQTAKQAGCVKKHCVTCDRAIRETDFVSRDMRLKTQKGKPGDAYGWSHVACDPPSPRQTKRAIREAEKPLLTEC